MFIVFFENFKRSGFSMVNWMTNGVNRMAWIRISLCGICRKTITTTLEMQVKNMQYNVVKNTIDIMVN